MQKKSYLIWLMILCLAAFADLFIPVLLGMKYPGYNSFKEPISTLGTPGSPVQIFERITLVAVGVLFLLFAFGQSRWFTKASWATSWYTAGIIIFAVGCILSGFFSETAPGMSETASGKIHGIASGLGFLFLILCPLWAVWISDFVQLRTVNIVLFAAGFVSFAVFLASENITHGFLQYTGLFQRINLVILYGALILNFSLLKPR